MIRSAAMETGNRGEGKIVADHTQRIVLAHGGGGQLTDELIERRVLPRLGNNVLNELLDSAILRNIPACDLAMTIDGYVVQPWKFPGGDIGRLSVSGTVNDLAVSGAEPLGLALSFILAEGFAGKDLDEIVNSIAQTAAEAGVKIITGDTKVVGRGQADGIYIVTSGVGRVRRDAKVGPSRVKPGQKLIVNGAVGEHGLAVMLTREMPEVTSVLRTDAAPLNKLIAKVLDAVGTGVTFMRDPTRGGLAGLCSDLAKQSAQRVTLNEVAIPIRSESRHAAEMLGLDPLEIANEGKVVMAVEAEVADRVMEILRNDPLGVAASVIGEIGTEADGRCEILTEIGGRRVLQKPYGEQLPRIC